MRVDETKHYKEVRCNLCSRKGLISIPRIIGDVLNTNIMFVGQCPGFSPKGVPDTHIACFGYNFTCETLAKCVEGFDNLYFTNVVKCAKRDDITNEQAATCMIHFFIREIEFVNPRLVLCVGRFAQDCVTDIKHIIGNTTYSSFEIKYITHPGALKRNNASDSEVRAYINKVRELIYQYEEKDTYSNRS